MVKNMYCSNLLCISSYLGCEPDFITVVHGLQGTDVVKFGLVLAFHIVTVYKANRSGVFFNCETVSISQNTVQLYCRKLMLIMSTIFRVYH